MFKFADQKKSQNRSLQDSIKIIAIFANCIGLLPVNGVTSDFASDLKFSWKSLKVVYTFVLLLLGSVRLVASVLYLFQKYSFPAMSE